MSDVVIKVENLTKEYRLGVINHGTLAKDLQAWWARKRGKDDPNSPINMNKYSSATASAIRTPNTEKTDSHGLRPSDSEQRKNNNDDLSVSSEARSVIKNDENAFNDKENRCTSEARSVAKNDKIYALKDINFEVRQGEVLGIIGANGAGKSTLLKILSRVTSPTSGCVKIKGRIGSLLEVGTGFHPELTGRENIYLNGAILGMKKWEIDKKLDEIIDFSGVEKFIDTPVKRYSSGMYVRLGFAVAAHLDPEILVIDEVLAVGDAEFQKKCLGKMDDISKKEGRTVLFVSHNMAAVRQLCKMAVLLEGGSISLMGPVENTVSEYLKRVHSGFIINKINVEDNEFPDGDLLFKSIVFRDMDEKKVLDMDIYRHYYVDIGVHIKQWSNNYKIGMIIYNSYGECSVVYVDALNCFSKIKRTQGDIVVRAKILNQLSPGEYSMVVNARRLSTTINKVENIKYNVSNIMHGDNRKIQRGIFQSQAEFEIII
jgi:ABC-type polysaccharide/polyol phosphate transport system ATPase subunit